MKRTSVVYAVAEGMGALRVARHHGPGLWCRIRLLVPAGVFVGSILLGACSNQKNEPAANSPQAAFTFTATSTPTASLTPRAAGTAAAGITFPGLAPISPTGVAGAIIPPAGGLQQVALGVTDLPSGFALTASGPGGPELGPNVTLSYQEEFQQRAIQSTRDLQQTIVIVDLLGQYRDPASALAGIKSVNVQTLNQILGPASLTAEPATIPLIGEDAAAYHFSGNTNGISVGGYLLIFHRGPMAAMVVTAAVKDAESLPQTIDLAQKQDQKLQASAGTG